MDKFRGGGLIMNISPKQLENLLVMIFPQIEYKPRIFGCDFVYKNNKFELYIDSTDDNVYLLQIDYEGESTFFLDCFNLLKNKLLEAKIEFDLGYYIVDNEGNQISEDFIL